MVLPGQYLERPALIRLPDGEGEALVLEGLYHRGDRRPALLVCPDPGPGGGMDSPVVAELAWACARAGHPSLRFQHRGRGGSQGGPDPSRALDDALAALDHVAATAPGPVSVAGVGAGCATALALAAARPEVDGVVLVAPTGSPGSGNRRVLVLLPEAAAGEAGALAAASVPGARVEVIAGADRLFLAGLPAVGRRAVEWIGGG